MNGRVETVPESIEHLDFAPPCQAKYNSCGGQNTAAYLVISKCCGWERLFCSECVARKVRMTPYWCCMVCGVETDGPWLDTVTLHPLGGRP